MKRAVIYSLLISVGFAFISCSEQSSNTGWDINDKKNGGFFVNTKYKGQQTGPGLVFVEGGTFVMGRVEEDAIKDWNNVPRRVSVASFYMDETEVTNTNYNEYLYWLGRVYDLDYYPEIYNTALPDTLVWRDELSYNEVYVENYLRHPAYREYPVVGVSWYQARAFCNWKTKKKNLDQGYRP